MIDAIVAGYQYFLAEYRWHVRRGTAIVETCLIP